MNLNNIDHTKKFIFYNEPIEEKLQQQPDPIYVW